ncbi:MAG: hypothetical protein OEM15_06250 [Myxococcales bacterium]|nr:hypothetical protein [Myxococcales bacterium]MDH3484387.1 hypothetical protein [Myxococcales bacterium]
MIRRILLVVLTASLGVIGCGSSDSGGTGGASDEGVTRGTGIGGAGGEGGTGGEGGAGGEVGPIFTSVMDRIEAGLAYRLEGCRCQGPGEPISESACLALVNFTELPASDRQNACFDEVILGEEEMTLENRLACLIEVDLAAADCLAEVSGCAETAIADCVQARTMGAGSCPTPQDSVLGSFFGCQATVVEDGVDAFLDSRSAQCDCLTNCTSADPDPAVFECMVDTLQAELDMLGPQGPTELKCINEFWRRKAVCFGNEMTCDGAATACADLPPMLCGISGTILDDCLLQ